MTTGFKTVNGMKWPETDVDCMSVTFSQVQDVDAAIGFCKKRYLVVQAGGNAGVWPLYLSERFGTVITFEPDPITYQCLEENCSGKMNVFPHWAALGNKRQKVSMDYPEGLRNMGAARVFPDERGTIRMLALDDRPFPTLDLLQLDTEGTEPLIILGALDTIRRHKPVIMLEDKGLSKDYGYLQGWPENLLGSEGYKHVASINRDVIYVHGDNL